MHICAVTRLDGKRNVYKSLSWPDIHNVFVSETGGFTVQTFNPRPRRPYIQAEQNKERLQSGEWIRPDYYALKVRRI